MSAFRDLYRRSCAIKVTVALNPQELLQQEAGFGALYSRRKIHRAVLRTPASPDLGFIPGTLMGVRSGRH